MKRMSMKKNIGFLSLVVLFCNLSATRIKLKEGNCVDVPDTIIIENDMDEDVTILETIGGFDGYFTGHHSLPKSKSHLVNGARWLDELKVKLNGKEYDVAYPTTDTYRDEIDHVIKKEVKAEFKYNLSDLIKANQEKSFAPTLAINLTEQEEIWLSVERRG